MRATSVALGGSVVSAAIIEGNLILGLSDGSVINCGYVQGPQGLTGPEGPMGASGSRGVDGSTIVTVGGTPGNEIGKDGDYAIDNINWRIYGPKSGGVWGKAKEMLPGPENILENGRSAASGGGSMGGSGNSSGGGGALTYTNGVFLTNDEKTLLNSTAQYKTLPNAPAGATAQKDVNMWNYGAILDNIDALIPVATGLVPPTPLPGFSEVYDGRLWFDSNPTELTLKIYNNGAWVVTTPPVDLTGIENDIDTINNTITDALVVQADLEARVTAGEAEQATIQAEQTAQNTQISDLGSKVTVLETTSLDHTNDINDLENKVDALQGDSLSGTWAVTLTGNTRPGKVLLYKDGFQGGVTAWSDVKYLGFAAEDAGGVTHDFSDVVIDEYIRFTANLGEANACTFKVTDNSGGNGIFEVVISVQKGVPVDGEDHRVEFLPPFDPSQYATNDYVDSQDDLKLNLTGGDMTGAIKFLVSTTTTSALEIRDPNDTTTAARPWVFWCPGGAGTQNKYVGRNNTDHWFQVYDAADANPVTTAKFGYKDVELSGNTNVTYGITDAHYLKGRVLINGPSGDLKADFTTSNADFFTKARFKEGLVVKGSGQAIAGDNIVHINDTYFSYNGRIANPTDVTNKEYVDGQNALYLPLTGGTLTEPLNFQRGSKTDKQFKISPNSGADYATNIYSLAGGDMRLRTSHTANEGDHVGSHIILQSNGGAPQTKIYNVVQPTNDSMAAPKSYVDQAVTAGAGVPIGTVVMWFGTTAPDGWLKCDGSNFNITTYSALHAHLQTVPNYTSGKTPDFRGLYPGGVGSAHNNQLNTANTYYSQRTAEPNGGAPSSSVAFNDGGTKTANQAGGTNFASTRTRQVQISDGWDLVTRPPTLSINFIIKG